MTKSKALLSAAAVLSGVTLAVSLQPVRAQAKRATPERQLLGVALGRPFLEVIRRYNQPQEVQTVALQGGADQLPGLGGAAAGGSASSGGYPGGGGGGYPGGGSSLAGEGAFGGGNPFGGGGGYPGGGGGGYPGGGGGGYPGGGGGGYPGGGGGGYPGGGGAGIPSLPPAGGGAFGGEAGAAQGGPEYSNAVLWIYKRPGNVRLEFLVNEDGRVAQISAAAPTDKPLKVIPAGAKTSRGITLGSTYGQVLAAYGNPERYRMLPGARFHEVYYTKNNHAAFTFDLKSMKVARITIALAD